ncbi:MAG: hypothetical protein PHN64_04400 [Desulfovibrionaceae bacterium]|jgi:hypothetical protein|nr:hypothetical protein [Desulfovibrionaceae bacterium]
MNASLHIRLKNCLQTILELEPDIQEELRRSAFAQEFTKIRYFLDKVESIDLKEEEVARLEKATATFLAELHLDKNSSPEEKGRVLQ